MSKESPSGGEKVISTNPSAHSNYFIQEVLEAGIMLQGTEVKSIRAQSPNLKDAWIEVRSRSGKFEAYLLNAHIGPYTHGNIWNHESLRKRKLLLHTHQLSRLYVAVTQKGMTLVPTKMYFKKGRVKVEVGVGKGKKKFDKRETLKKKSADREMEQARKR
ncbi:MAG: SsrA-binding protein SmpB [Bdellovibrio sp.]|nr:SsrA-binding protein SmpB [Bdellovibrio sp.]